jgi:hypothetical protein
MSEYLVRPRSSIADPELARLATLDLPAPFRYPRPEPREAIAKALAAWRGSIEPERMIVMTLAPVPARSRR